MNDELAWRKSSYSDDQGGDCVEVAISLDTMHVRDSKITAGPQLTVTSGAWDALVATVAGRAIVQ